MVIDPGVGVAQDDRPVAHPEVDELVAIDVPHVAAEASVNVDRVVAPGAEVRARAAGQGSAGPRVHRGLAIPSDGWRRACGWLGGHGPSGVEVGECGAAVATPSAWSTAAAARARWAGRCAWRDTRPGILAQAMVRRQRDIRTRPANPPRNPCVQDSRVREYVGLS